MVSKSLMVEDVRLDLHNPRITEAASQRDALQKIVNDQDVKLVALAESIVEEGLNPMDRLLVIASNEKGKFIVIEGNRRLAAIKILQNPSVLTGLDVRAPVQKRLEALAANFDIKNIEPLDCFEVAAREDGASWIQQRHTGENSGRGIVGWGGIATARFRGNDPALQALDFVLKHGGLTVEQKGEINNGFPISTLDRLLSTPAVRAVIGVDIKGGKLLSGLPIDEVVKPLLRMVLDLASGAVTVTALKLQPQMVAYVNGLGTDLPDLAKASSTRVPVESLVESQAGATGGGTKPTGGAGTKTKPRAPVRKVLIQRHCAMKVTTPKIAEIEKELRALSLSDSPHAISVLLRVFLELSVDHYLSAQRIDLYVTQNARKIDKSLKSKVAEAIAQMVVAGAPKKELDGISKGINNKNSPLFIDTLHNYIHNRFYSPTERDLTVAWDNAQPFFERLWA